MNNEQTNNFLSDSLQELEIKLDEPWGELFSTCPATLYHYTDTNGLYGIIDSGKIWATNIKYLNDASEITYAQQLVADTLKNLINNESDETVQNFLQIQLKHYIGEEEIPHIYVACLCEKSNLLSQWRTYGAEGSGFALGIDARLFLGEHSRGEPRTFVLRPVIYDEGKQRVLVEREITSVIALLKETMSRGIVVKGTISGHKFSNFLRDRLNDLLYCFKHKAFETENEWRFVSVEETIEKYVYQHLLNTVFAVERKIPIKFRRSAKMLIPYIELDITSKVGNYGGRIPLVTVAVGPTRHPLLGRASLNMFLRSKDYDPDLFTMIETSNIPLRV